MEQEQVLSSGKPERARLTRDFVRDRIARYEPSVRGLSEEQLAEMRGDHTLDPAEDVKPLFRPAAVLIGLIEREDGLHVLLTRRTDHLKSHAGQVAFPGGRIEAFDESPTAGALREAQEEVGLPPDYVEVIGRIDTYLTRTSFEITPIVGFVRQPYPVTPDPIEVADVFEVPLDFLVDPVNHQRNTREIKGKVHTFFAMPYREWHIWGVTAGILVNLAEVLAPT